MSAISGFGGGSQLAQWLQAIRKKQTSLVASGTSATPSTGTTPAGASATTQSTTGTTATPGIQGTHKHHGGGSDFFSKIQQTVTNALQAAKANGSTEDPNEVVKDSIASLLKNLGVGSGSAGAPLNADTNTDEPGSADPTTTQQSFQTLLQSAGITPQQFQSDFLAAIQESQNGSANPANAFAGLLKGTALDVVG